MPIEEVSLRIYFPLVGVLYLTVIPSRSSIHVPEVRYLGSFQLSLNLGNHETSGQIKLPISYRVVRLLIWPS